MVTVWIVLLLLSVYLLDTEVESKISMMDLDAHRFYMHNRSPRKLHVHRIRHTIMHNGIESYHDHFKAIDLEPNQTSTFYRMYIKNAPSAEESYQDEWFAHLLYDNKNYTLTTTPFFCRVIDRDLCDPILVVFDLDAMRFHIVPAKSKNCSVGVEHNPEKDYEYKDYVELFWQTTNHGCDSPIFNKSYKCTAIDPAEAALEEEFLEGINKGTEVKHRYSVVMYGVPAAIEDEVELSQWILNFLRDTMKINTLAASDILTVKRMRGGETCKPVQLTMKSFEMKETVLAHRRFIKFSNIKIENFLQRDDMIKIGKLVKISKSLRQAGHFSVVKDELLFVDHVLVNTSQDNLVKLFPYMPKSLFDDV